MAPLRRYLRISRYTVLETRVYLDDPSLQSWLLGRDAALDKVIAAVKPLVLPKLMEERDRGPKRKSIRDVVRGDDFEVGIFLAETDNRHTVMMKHRNIQAKGEVDNDAAVDNVPSIREESDDESTAAASLANIPSVAGSKRAAGDGFPPPKRRHTTTDQKPTLDVSYQGFAIYGRVLCLVVKRLHARPATGQAVMENWLSTQEVSAALEGEGEGE